MPRIEAKGLSTAASEKPFLATEDKTMLENFDDLFVGNPVQIEQNLRQLLPQASALEDKSIYLQILSQIALAEVMQKKIRCCPCNPR